MLALRLPEDIESRLDKLAKATGRTKSFYAREAILEHLADRCNFTMINNLNFRGREVMYPYISSLVGINPASSTQ